MDDDVEPMSIVEAISPRVAAAQSIDSARYQSSSHNNPYGPPGSIPAPMIVLQDNPMVLQSNHNPYQPEENPRSRTLNPSNPRHQREMRRQEDNGLLPSYLLDTNALENIVIRHAPVPDQVVFGRSEPPPPGLPMPERDNRLTREYSSSDLEALGNELDAGTSSGELSSRRQRRHGHGRRHAHRQGSRTQLL